MSVKTTYILIERDPKLIKSDLNTLGKKRYQKRPKIHEERRFEWLQLKRPIYISKETQKQVEKDLNTQGKNGIRRALQSIKRDDLNGFS